MAYDYSKIDTTAIIYNTRNWDLKAPTKFWHVPSKIGPDGSNVFTINKPGTFLGTTGNDTVYNGWVYPNAKNADSNQSIVLGTGKDTYFGKGFGSGNQKVIVYLDNANGKTIPAVGGEAFRYKGDSDEAHVPSANYWVKTGIGGIDGDWVTIHNSPFQPANANATKIWLATNDHVAIVAGEPAGLPGDTFDGFDVTGVKFVYENKLKDFAQVDELRIKTSTGTNIILDFYQKDQLKHQEQDKYPFFVKTDGEASIDDIWDFAHLVIDDIMVLL